jgi:hypothetical protein
MRFIQCARCNKLIPAGEYDAHIGRSEPTRAASVSGDIEPFRSTVDGTIIGSRRDLREHNARHGVVTAAEYGGHVNVAAQKRREAAFKGERSTAESFRIKQNIHEAINHLERK